MDLRLEKPLAVFDLETTGVDPATDKIVEVAVLRLLPDGGRDMKCRRINPERPIPAGATRVHGIRDEDVADAPTFRQIAPSLLEFLADADLAGFNVERFDVPLLDREFRECGLDLELGSRRIVDAMRIFHRKEPRDLTAAAKFYLERDHVDAHAAEADVEMTAEILLAQLRRYDDLPDDVAGLAEFCSPSRPGAIDRQGKFVWRGDEPTIAFGKHAGTPLPVLAARHPDYLEWILKTDFPEDAKRIASEALGGRFPEPATTTSG